MSSELRMAVIDTNISVIFRKKQIAEHVVNETKTENNSTSSRLKLTIILVINKT